MKNDIGVGTLDAQFESDQRQANTIFIFVKMDVWKAHQIMDKLPKKSDAPNLPEKYHIFHVPAFCQGRSHCKKTFVALNILPMYI